MFNERDRIVNQPVLKSLISLTLPAIGSSVFFVIFEIVDMFWVGKLGPLPVAALSTASFFVWMLRAMSLAVATGAIAMVSRRAGENNTPKLLETTKNAILAGSIFPLVVTLFVFPFTLKVFHWIRLKPEVAHLSREYTVVFLTGFLFVCLMVTAEHIIRGMGNTKIPMFITAFSLLLNTFLDPIFIFHFRMGLKGAAYATILSQMVGCVLLLGAILFTLPEIKRSKLHLDKNFFKNYFFPMLRIGTPISLSGVSFSMIYLVLSGIISLFGNAPLAAMGIGHRIEAFPFFIAFGFSMAVATMVGQNLGAGKPEKAKASVFLSLKIASGILLLASVIFFFFAEKLYGFFISNEEVIQYGIGYLRIIALFEVFLALEVILEGAFSGAGDTKPPFIVVFPITFLRIPLSYLFGVTLGFGVTAVWFVISVTTFIKGVLLLVWFNKGNWIVKKV